ncbi:unnamed protein product [Prunus armeniaca]
MEELVVKIFLCFMFSCLAIEHRFCLVASDNEGVLIINDYHMLVFPDVVILNRCCRWTNEDGRTWKWTAWSKCWRKLEWSHCFWVSFLCASRDTRRPSILHAANVLKSGLGMCLNV